jgi:hypothetical protein
MNRKPTNKQKTKISREKILRKKNFSRKFRERYASFHSSFTYSTRIDGIVGSRGSCEATKR